MKDILLEKIEYSCPLCDSKHEVEVRERQTQALIKGEIVNYNEVYYLCTVTSDEENEFVPSKLLNKNLLRVRDSFRASKGLLTSGEIKEIRKKYSLTQSEFAFLLGWGEVTVTRYESKKIQDETYDSLMRIVGENPSFALKSLIIHQDKFEIERYEELREIVRDIVLKDKNQSLKHQELDNLYLPYEEATELNGFKKLDLDKIANVIGYFAENTMYMYKVKLMKLLWYTDLLFFARFNCSMTGLVYEHRTYGALPIGFNDILGLPTVNVKEELIYDNIAYKIVSNGHIDTSVFTDDEMAVLEYIADKFKSTNGRDIVEYMHKEKAYLETEERDIISYRYAEELNEVS